MLFSLFKIFSLNDLSSESSWGKLTVWKESKEAPSSQQFYFLSGRGLMEGQGRKRMLTVWVEPLLVQVCLMTEIFPCLSNKSVFYLAFSNSLPSLKNRILLEFIQSKLTMVFKTLIQMILPPAGFYGNWK